jgi:hypothetical protein
MRGAPGAFTLYASGSFDSSVRVRWEQFFQPFRGEVDVVYWNDAYPNTPVAGVN